MPTYETTKFLSLPQQVNKNKKDIETLQQNQAYISNLIPKTEKGQPLGVATLDAAGKVPSTQLPSFVDDVLEYANLSSFPTTGETDKIYIAKDTNKTYRWSGSNYVEISASLALGETSSTAYRGDRGKIAYDHTSLTNNPHSVTKTQVGLGNVDNTSDETKYVQGLRETRANVNTKIWTGTQTQYDSIVTKDATTLYFITE